MFAKLAWVVAGMMGPVDSVPQTMPASVNPTGMELVQAALLLDMPSGTPETPPADSIWPGLQLAIRQVAVARELMDEREAKYVFVKVEWFPNELDMIRRRREDLADAPFVSDAARLPPRDAVNKLVEFNRAFKRHVENLAKFDGSHQNLYRAVLTETDELYRAWDKARDANCPFYYVTVRRQALKDLRSAIGPDAYSTMTLPAAAPYWRFNQMR